MDNMYLRFIYPPLRVYHLSKAMANSKAICQRTPITKVDVRIFPKYLVPLYITTGCKGGLFR